MRSIALITAGLAIFFLGMLAVLIDSAFAASRPEASFTGWSLVPIALGALLVWMGRFFPPITYPYNPAKAQRMLERARSKQRPQQVGKARPAERGRLKEA